MKFNETAKFSKELKTLSKKYRSLSDDLAEFKKVITSIPCGTSKHSVMLHNAGDFKIIKSRFFCRYLRGSSMRIVYAYYEKKQQVEFIELYFKGDKERADAKRLDEYIMSCCAS
ncbi:MAG: hypothetical protein ABIE74_11760 [Pseudomonadota bacterium]